jgi:integrase
LRVQLYRGRYYAVWREHGQTKRRALRADNRADAERTLADQLRKPTGKTVADIVKVYLEEKSGARSHEAMRYSWKALEPHFGHYRPDQITPALCKAYAKSRKVSAGTIIKDLGMLRTALKGKGAEIWLPSSPPPRDRYLTRSEFDRLIKATSLPHIRLFIALALATGGRAGAILGLTWDRIDFGKGQIRLADGSTGGKGRAAVPMNASVRTALETAYKGRTGDWVIEWGGRPVRSVKRAFREACARAKLEAVTPHVLRHTAAVWMIEAGASITEVAQYLGHSDTRTTFRVYARHSPDHLRNAAKALEF